MVAVISALSWSVNSEFGSFAFSRIENLEIPVILNTAKGILGSLAPVSIVAMISRTVASKSSMDSFPSME